MLQGSCWTEQALEPAEVDSDPMCKFLGTSFFYCHFQMISLHRIANAPDSPGIPLSHTHSLLCSTIEKMMLYVLPALTL